MDTFIQLTVDALTLGSVYALIALGYTLVYGVLKLLNFAHGDVFMVGSFVGYGVLAGARRPDEPGRADLAPAHAGDRSRRWPAVPVLGVVDRALRLPTACVTRRASRR